ncbi:hypothetical protein Z517_03645 [Fonsecaea pedrosoi CBS 271.37]|uniref:Unplaced genomic scaffold supercont1.2, whole genome shotgun sequence n=1 Tax=Fonsecaea pedrosoi CBS 271.37 TaxID=1442368 RepID=A0A0D2H0K3_9EURO|nr:uncharacterized protein Z517_03645 [Fonsecaea pedrosoi CBS 271.37]KIW84395.1 hypothetical protein Z517_03645 [Fonsecaea pedrosoi CBS 271.37]
MGSASAYPSLEWDDSIRLFELSRSDLPGGRLYGRLTSVRLSNCPEYCAISYVWKEPRTKHVVLSKDCTIDVPDSLFDGLSEILREREVKLIWADQVCIRQADDHEKESQVVLMAQIYGHAHLVIAWLGKPAEDTRLAFRLLEFFAALPSETRGVVEGSEAQRPLLILEELAQELCLDDRVQVFADPTNAAWRGVFALVKRPWFTRFWVVQEVALSSNLSIRCGKFEISGDPFCRVLRLISMIALFPPPVDLMNDFNLGLQLTNLRGSIMVGKSQSFLHLAHRFSHWNCTDDRDRLNALVSVAFKGNPSPWFSPNYRTDVGGVYQIFAESYISATGNLDILHFAGDSRPVVLPTAGGLQIYNVPYMNDESNVAATWSPDWRIKTRPLPFLSENSVNDGLAFSATHSVADFQLDSSRRRLRVRALLVNEVKVIGPPLLPDCLRSRSQHSKLREFSTFGLLWQDLSVVKMQRMKTGCIDLP